MTTVYRHFNSANSLADWFMSQREANGPLNGYHPMSTEAHATALEGVKDMREGTLDNLDKAQEIVDQLALHIDISTPMPQLDVMGAYPDVPSYLSGVPDDMWNMVPSYTEKSPITLWVGLTSQGSISTDVLMKRGTAIAAFVLAMANIRPVIVRPYVATGGSVYGTRDNYGSRNRRYNSRRSPEATVKPTPKPKALVGDNIADDGTRHTIISWDIQTTPMVLAELMTVARPEVTRYFGIEVCQQMWGKVATNDTRFHPDSLSETKMREHLGVQEDDVYLPQITELDPMIANPVEWVRTQVLRYTSGEATDYATEEQAENMRRYGEAFGS